MSEKFDSLIQFLVNPKSRGSNIPGKITPNVKELKPVFDAPVAGYERLIVNLKEGAAAKIIKEMKDKFQVVLKQQK